MRRAAPFLVGALVAACGSDEPSVRYVLLPDPVADLRADSNRDGVVRFDDESDANKLEWSATNGAVFLANIDDDSERCGVNKNDNEIALCNDAADENVNGDDDAADLARLWTRPLPDVPGDMTATIEVVTPEARDRVRLFSRTGPNAADFTVLFADTVFNAADLREGIELGIEAKDIVRDKEVWDGFVDVKLTLTTPRGESSDTVRLRVAPVLTFHHLLPAERIWQSQTGRQGNADLRRDLTRACEAAGVPPPALIEENDPWTQDFFEPAYMSMPAPNGGQHVIRVNYRSANVYEPEETDNPLRPAGAVVFRLRGKDVAGVQEFDLTHPPEMDTLNSFGNLETVPPYSAGGVAYPFGRLLRGATQSFFPDPVFEKMLEAQGQQPPILIDTSWLRVAHVDETVSFVKAATPRGWKLLVNDPRLAKTMLEDAAARGHGATTMFVGKEWYDPETERASPAEVSIAEVLADPIVMQASAEAAAEVDAQLAILRKELALADDEIVRVPFLHTLIDGGSIAYQPGLVNGVYLADGHFGAPNPHGPIIDGKDIFADAFTKALAPLGITAHFLEDWDEYHVANGEVHCGTNATRQVPDAKWWEAGR
ncbi:MAG: protein-arginine deiminase [Labilithrix sp.]|nr:protein-arginine deiminase [Labilithrix sp.]MCW5816158.1 protein-arginine deiminase [Labilithrix sp.]